MSFSRTNKVRIGLTNVTGLGATELTKSLLPALEKTGQIVDIYLPATGPLANYKPLSVYTVAHKTRRRLPNAVSRIIECTLMSGRFKHSLPILILGDLPVRITGRQVVFFHNQHLLGDLDGTTFFQRVKFSIARALLRFNSPYIDAAIVQTKTMKRGLKAAYPALSDKIHVIPQPAPEWLLSSGIRRTGRVALQKLRLFYPAAPYPHKNHSVLYKTSALPAWNELVGEMVVTVPSTQDMRDELTIRAVGRLDANGMREEYAKSDALVFPSLAESYGLPLVEAMWLGLPIICADLPYARDLCGSEAIYFSPKDPASLENAIAELSQRLNKGWWPNWESRLESIPSSWDDVATRMVLVTQVPDHSSGNHKMIDSGLT